MSKERDMTSSVTSHEEKFHVVCKVNFHWQECLFSQRNFKCSPEKEDVEEMCKFSALGL